MKAQGRGEGDLTFRGPSSSSPDCEISTVGGDMEEGEDAERLLGSAAIIPRTSARIEEARNSTCLISSSEKSLRCASEAWR